MNKKRTKKRVYEKILNVFAWLSFVLAILVCALVIFSSFSGEKNGKEVFGYKFLMVASDSMSKSHLSENEEIFFEVGDVIIIEKINDYSSISVGDVISFISHNQGSVGKTLSHKVREVVKTSSGEIIGFETYGIHTGESDSVIVEPNAIIGKYVGKIPNLGHVFEFLRKPAGYFVSILTPCVLLIIFFSIKVGKFIARKELADSYDSQLNALEGRLIQLEQPKESIDMQTTKEEMAVTTDTVEVVSNEQVNNQTPKIGEQQPYAQPQQAFCLPNIQPIFNEKALELTIGSLNKTIDTLTRTIENLVNMVEKPVDSLTRTVETLAVAKTTPTIVEKVVEVPVSVQPLEQQPQVAPVENKEQVAQQEIKEQVSQPTPVVPVVVEPIVEKQSVVEKQPQEVVESISELPAREKIPFNKKLLSLDSEIKNYFSEVHNELISYKKVSYRISFKGVSYRLGRKALAKVVVRGKTLKLHLALNVNDYPKTVFFQTDSSDVKMYEDVPFTIKIKSNRGKNNAVKLVNALAENNNLVKIDGFTKENILKTLKSFK